jgi:starvation-inducible DNA-binding protein
MQAVHSELRQGARQAAIGVLTQILSDEQVLVIKLRNYHWNVVGPSFRELHALFEEQYGILAVRIDEVAERMRALGAHATGTMAEYLQHTALREHPGRFASANEMSGDLLADHQIITRYITEALERPAGNILDVGAIDMLTGLVQDHEKMSWQLSSMLLDKRDEHGEHYAVYDAPASLSPHRASDKHDDHHQHYPGLYES